MAFGTFAEPAWPANLVFQHSRGLHFAYQRPDCARLSEPLFLVEGQARRPMTEMRHRRLLIGRKIPSLASELGRSKWVSHDVLARLAEVRRDWLCPGKCG